MSTEAKTATLLCLMKCKVVDDWLNFDTGPMSFVLYPTNSQPQPNSLTVQSGLKVELTSYYVDLKFGLICQTTIYKVKNVLLCLTYKPTQKKS